MKFLDLLRNVLRRIMSLGKDTTEVLREDYANDDVMGNAGLALVTVIVFSLQIVVKYTWSCLVSIVTPPAFFTLILFGKKIDFLDRLANKVGEWWYSEVERITFLDLGFHTLTTIVTWGILGLIALLGRNLKHVGFFWDYHYTFSLVYFISQIINFGSIKFLNMIEVEEEERAAKPKAKPMTRTTTGYKISSKEDNSGRMPKRRDLSPKPLIEKIEPLGTPLRRDKVDNNRAKVEDEGQKPKSKPESPKQKVTDNKPVTFASVSMNKHDGTDKFYEQFIDNLEMGKEVSVSLVCGKPKKGIHRISIGKCRVGNTDDLNGIKSAIQNKLKESPDDTGVPIKDREYGINLKAGKYITVPVDRGYLVLGG